MEDGACQVWWARPGPVCSELLDLLDGVERARAAAYRQPVDRDRFVTACVVLRRVLAAALGVPAEEVILDRVCPHCGRPHGKPRLVAAGVGVQFSVSHSGDLVAVALHRSQALGVDVERINAGLETAELVEHALTAAESAQLGALAPDERSRAFTTYWTRKEAIVKATGEGLRAPLAQLAVSSPDEPARLLAWPGHAQIGAAVRLHDLYPRPGYAAALAVISAEPVAVRELDATRWLK